MFHVTYVTRRCMNDSFRAFDLLVFILSSKGFLGKGDTPRVLFSSVDEIRCTMVEIESDVFFSFV